MPGEQPWVTAEPPPPGDLHLRATVPKPAVPNGGARNKASQLAQQSGKARGMGPEHAVPHGNPVTGIRSCWKHKQAGTRLSFLLPRARNSPAGSNLSKPGVNWGRSSQSSWAAVAAHLAGSAAGLCYPEDRGWRKGRKRHHTGLGCDSKAHSGWKVPLEQRGAGEGFS